MAGAKAMENIDTELVELCRDLIRQPSLSGKEEGVAMVIKKKMEDLGYDDIHIDDYGNVIGGFFGKRPGKTVVMDGHIDTVDISDRSRWTHDPFAADIDNGRIYGRGTSDMKGADSAMIIAAARFARNRDFAGKVYVSCSCQEEIFEGVSTRAVSEYCRPDYVIIGESTQLRLNIGQRGRAEIVVETEGKTCHSANPEKGVNAVRHMVALLEEIFKIEPAEHPLLGKGMMELTDIVSSPFPGQSVVPGLCTATFDRRLIVGDTPEKILEPINQAIEKVRANLPNLKARCYIREGEHPSWKGMNVKATRFFPGWVLDKDDELVRKAYKGITEAGVKTELSHYSFCTNGSHFCGEAGIKTIGFGPSLENLAHTIDEYIEIDQLQKAELGYEGILKELLK
jgi:putative selenium metabolism hydrolase